MINSRWRGGGRFSEPAKSLSILDLVNFGTLDLRLVSILWLIMERRASVLVTAEPRLAGKSTLLRALLDFLRPEVKQIHLGNRAEDFRFSQHTVPVNTYMVAAEISDNSFYLWGDEARRAFELLSRGYALGGTMHAKTVEEAVDILHTELRLPLSVIAHLDAVITIRMIEGWSTEPTRRVETVGLIGPEKDGLSIQIIASRSPDSGELNFTSEGDLYAALSNRFGISFDYVTTEMTQRERFLSRLLNEDRYSRDDVRKAILGFYQSGSS